MLVFVVLIGWMDCGSSPVGSPGFDSVAPDRYIFGDDDGEGTAFRHCLKSIHEGLRV